MRLKYRLRKSTRQYIMVAGLCITVIGGAATATSILITGQVREEYKYRLSEVMKEREGYRREVYSVKSDIRSGEVIREDMLEYMRAYSSQPQESYMDKSSIGKIALVDIPMGTHLLEVMLTDQVIDAEFREVQYSAIRLNSNLRENDFADIRICYPNGEDYTILAKKVIHTNDSEGAACYIWLTEEEILRMQSAVIDAHLYPGAYLYTAKYIEPALQQAAVVNYEPTLEAIELIRSNPNIIETAANELSMINRMALENRLAENFRKDVSMRRWELGEYNSRYQYESIEEHAGSRSEIAAGMENDRYHEKKDLIGNSYEENDEEDRKGKDGSFHQKEEPELGEEVYEKDYFVVTEG